MPSPGPAHPAARFPALAVMAAVVAVCACPWAAPRTCRGDDAQPRGLAAANWKLESLELTDGRRLEGLIVASDDDGVAFVQIVRRPGRQMFLVTWGRIAPERIRMLQRLPPPDRAELANRVEAFRGRRDAALSAELAVRLSRASDDAPWTYVGPWFAVESSADAKLTRETVARLEQVFEALESLVPPGRDRRRPPPAEPDATLQIRICGSAAEYREEQARLGVRVANPALYVPARRLLVAGSDMPAIIAEERQAADVLDLEEQAIAERDRTFAAAVRDLAAELERQGRKPAERAEIVTNARSRHDREKAGQIARLAAARRDNAARVAAVKQAFSAWLAHEAWHAYADVALGGRLPVWLDEGLAQVIETAPLELGELRLDAPDPERLTALHALLRSGRAPPLADVLGATADRFHIGQMSSRSAAHDAYLMAWGLAFDLALVEPALTPRSLATLTADGNGTDPRGQFAALVGTTVDAFEPAWRARMLALRPRAAITPPAPAPSPAPRPSPAPGEPQPNAPGR